MTLKLSARAARATATDPLIVYGRYSHRPYRLYACRCATPHLFAQPLSWDATTTNGTARPVTAAWVDDVLELPR